jgi:hypothetical protein
MANVYDPELQMDFITKQEIDQFNKDKGEYRLKTSGFQNVESDENMSINQVNLVGGDINIDQENRSNEEIQ